MARTKKQPQKSQLKTISANGTTVPVATSATSSEKVVVLFCSRFGQIFNLPDGRSVKLEGNGIQLAGQRDGALPKGGYSVNIVDKSAWEAVKKYHGKAYAPWFENGKIIEQVSEAKGVDYAAENAEDDPGLNPVDPTKTSSVEA